MTLRRGKIQGLQLKTSGYSRIIKIKMDGRRITST